MNFNIHKVDDSSVPRELDCFWESSSLLCGTGRFATEGETLIVLFFVPGLLLAYI